MGYFFGGINSHLGATSSAVTKWLEHEEPSTTGGEQDAALYALALEDLKPEQPEVLYVLRQSRLFNIPVFNGSYYDWPFIARLELMACINAENEYEAIKSVNRRLALNSATKAAGNG